MRGGRKTKVLVTQGAMKHSLAIIQYLAKQGYEVYATIPPQCKRTLAETSRYAIATYHIEEQNEEGCVSQLLALLQSASFDVLVPVGFPVTEFIARRAKDIARFVSIMCPEAAVCELAGDKLRIMQLAESLDIPTPRTYQIKSQTDLNTLGTDLQFPLVIKGRHESGKGIVSYAYEPSELVPKYEALCRRFNLISPDEYPILQEFIPGWGCAFFALYQHGVLKRIFMHRRIREYPASGGSSCCAESFYHDDLLSLGKRLLDKLGWHGVAMVECRFDTRKNQFTLIEVNAKFWGSLELALKAGADFAGDYVRGSLDQPLEYSRSFRHIRFQWPFDGDMLHAVDNPAAWRSVVTDFFNPFVSKGFHWSDPLPTLAKLYGTGCSLAQSLFPKRSGLGETRP